MAKEGPEVTNQLFELAALHYGKLLDSHLRVRRAFEEPQGYSGTTAVYAWAYVYVQ